MRGSDQTDAYGDGRADLAANLAPVIMCYRPAAASGHARRLRMAQVDGGHWLCRRAAYRALLLNDNGGIRSAGTGVCQALLAPELVHRLARREEAAHARERAAFIRFEGKHGTAEEKARARRERQEPDWLEERRGARCLPDVVVSAKYEYEK